jgi:hypothetical protein
MVIRLDKQTDCAILCKLIQKTIDRDLKENGDRPRSLVIKIADFIDSGDQHIPKLEHKE